MLFRSAQIYKQTHIHPHKHRDTHVSPQFCSTQMWFRGWGQSGQRPGVTVYPSGGVAWAHGSPPQSPLSRPGGAPWDSGGRQGRRGGVAPSRPRDSEPTPAAWFCQDGEPAHLSGLNAAHLPSLPVYFSSVGLRANSTVAQVLPLLGGMDAARNLDRKSVV